MKKRANINWDKSYMLTAEQVGLLGLENKSVREIQLGADSARLANAMNKLTVADLERWKEHLDI